MREVNMNKQFSLWLSIVAGMMVTILEILFQCRGTDIISLQSIIGNIAQYHLLNSFNSIALLYSAIAVGTAGNILCCALTIWLVNGIKPLRQKVQSINPETV